MPSDRARVRLYDDVEEQIAVLAKGAGVSVTCYVNSLLRLAVYNQMRPGRSYEVHDVTPVPNRAQGPLPEQL